MKKKLAVAGLLAGGIVLSGLAGSAYAQGGTPAAKPTLKPIGPKGHGVTVVACVKGGVPKGKPGQGKPEQGKVSIKEPGRLPAVPDGPPPPLTMRTGGKAVPAPGAKLVAKDSVKVAHGVPKLGPPPKGAHCAIVKPGVPAAPPAG